MNTRLETLTAWLNETDIEVAFINSKENVFYLSNFYTDPHERLMGIFVFQEAQPLFVLPAMEVNQLKDAGWQYEIIGYADHENPWKLIQSSLESKKLPKAKAVSLEKEGLSLSRSEALLTSSTTFAFDDTVIHHNSISAFFS